MVTAVFSVVAFDFFFGRPRFSFAVADTEYLLSFAGLLIVGLVVSTLTARSREQADAATRGELQAVALSELSRDLAASSGLGTSSGLDEILQIVLRHINEIFSRDAVILLRGGDRLEPRALSAGFSLDADELAVADWSFKHGQPAGRGTDTLPAAAVRYLPLKTGGAALSACLGSSPLTRAL